MSELVLNHHERNYMYRKIGAATIEFLRAMHTAFAASKELKDQARAAMVAQEIERRTTGKVAVMPARA